MKQFFVLFLVLGFVACATDEISALEDCQTDLNNESYSAAIVHCTAALEADASNAEAARLLANAYFGRSGIRYMDMVSGILDLGSSGDSFFQEMADVLPDPYTTTVSMDDVRVAIETLEAFSGMSAADLGNGTLADAGFDLGLMEAIEHFALGVYGADYFGTLDVSGIVDADATNAQTDLINFDNRLISSGVSETEGFIQDVRQTFCILEPISAGEGFTTAEFQALVGCELSTDPDTFDTAVLTADIANCAAIDPDNQGAAVQACYEADTTL